MGELREDERAATMLSTKRIADGLHEVPDPPCMVNGAPAVIRVLAPDLVASWPIDPDPAVTATSSRPHSRLLLIDQMRADGYALEAPEVIAKRLGIPMVPIAPPPSPLSAKWARRAEIDLVLAEDARKHPAFATARRAAVMAAFEGAPPVAPEEIVPVGHASNILRDCHRYEEKRGGMTKPSAKAVEWVALAVYERNRGAA